MKNYLKVIVIAILGFCLLLPTSGLAASSTLYYAAPGTSKNSAGIYKATPNGTATAVLKENMYSYKSTTKPPMKLEDMTNYAVRNKVIKYGDRWGNVTEPIQNVQAVGKDLYFTKFLFAAFYNGGGCGGGGADILELYKRSSSGKVTKVFSDKLSSYSEDQFVVSGDYIYYAKVENRGIGNYKIVKYSLKSKKKTTLYSGANNFWLNGKYIYIVKDKKTYRIDLNGKGKKEINTKVPMYSNGYCDDNNYHKSKNGFTVSGWDEKTEKELIYYYDFAKQSLVNIPTKTYGSIMDVDIKKKRYVGMSYNDDDSTSIVLYDFKGKQLKKLATIKDDMTLHTVDSVKGQILYIQASKLKSIKF